MPPEPENQRFTEGTDCFGPKDKWCALGVLLATNLVTRFGFDPTLGIANSETAKFALACLYSVIPAGLALIALPLLWAYPITRERQEALRAEIAAA